MNKPYDVFSSEMSIPFDIAAWCRGRRFSPASVALTRALEAKASAVKLVTLADQTLGEKEKELLAAYDRVREQMRVDPV